MLEFLNQSHLIWQNYIHFVLWQIEKTFEICFHHSSDHRTFRPEFSISWVWKNFSVWCSNPLHPLFLERLINHSTFANMKPKKNPSFMSLPANNSPTGKSLTSSNFPASAFLNQNQALTSDEQGAYRKHA